MYDKLQVKGCPLCEIFTKKNVITKLYWPETIEEVPDAEFVIVNCKTCRIPMLVWNEHITSVTREGWGRILYRCRKIFGGNVTLKQHNRQIRDHLHYHLTSIKK